MIQIYTQFISNRLKYIADFLFQTVLGTEVIYTFDEREFLNSTLPSINYTPHNYNKGVWIVPHRLLGETGIGTIEPETGNWDGIETLFPSSEGDIPFDLFAASFYLVSRYEEYGSKAVDKQNRFMCEASVSFDMGWIERPIVDEWALKLKEVLTHRYGDRLLFSPPSFRFASTIDLDHPYAYRYKSILMHIGKTVFDLLHFNLAAVKERWSVLLQKREDPFYNFDDIEQIHDELGLFPRFFALMGPYGKYDRKTLYPTLTYYNRLKKLAEKYEVGAHPSYKASFNRRVTMAEKSMLERIVGTEVVNNRQHYLRFKMPDTYRMLSELGIEHDYSMGYAPRYGFRAGTCHPHSFFDVENNCACSVLIHSTQVMDTTFKQYMKISPEIAVGQIKEMAEKCKSVNGEFVLLFHNSSLSELDGWKGWRKSYKEVLRYVSVELLS